MASIGKHGKTPLVRDLSPSISIDASHGEMPPPNVPPPNVDLSPLRATFSHVAVVFQNLVEAQRLDEETLTSAILGALSASFPLCAEIYGTTEERAEHPEGKRFSWAQYKKSRTKVERASEAQRGADFALVYWKDERTMRLAVFQAKSGQTSKIENPADTAGAENFKWELDVYRRPDKKDDGSWRESQLIRLARTGNMFLEAINHLDKGAPLNKCLESAQLITCEAKCNREQLSLNGCSWIHYISYFEAGTVTISIDNLSDQLAREIDKIGERLKENPVEVTDKLNPRSFLKMLCNCFSLEKNNGWLEIDAALGELLLPDLVDLVPIFVADDGTGRGLDLEIKGAEKLMRQVAETKLASEQMKSRYNRLVSSASPAPSP